MVFWMWFAAASHLWSWPAPLYDARLRKPFVEIALPHGPLAEPPRRAAKPRPTRDLQLSALAR